MLVSKSLSLGPPGPSPTCGGTTPPPACLEALFCHEIGPHLDFVIPVHVHQGEVRHRWCELIVKHKYTKAYKDVERFLQEDQAMGVYLYGELMLGEDARQQQVARRCFELTKEQMDRSSAEVVAEMLL